MADAEGNDVGRVRERFFGAQGAARSRRGEAVRATLAELGLGEADVTTAVKRARKRS